MANYEGRHGNFRGECVTCSKVKAQHQKSYGDLESLPTPVGKWEDITMDFITKFPMTKKGQHDMGDSRPINEECAFPSTRENRSMEKLAETYVKNIVKIHGETLSIVSGRDNRFSSKF